MRKKLLLVAVAAVVLSTITATQYVRADIGYEYSISHPSNSDIRYIGSDNSSDGIRVLRVDGSNSTHAKVKLVFGTWSADQNKTYTAAFGIVNEENFSVDITDITVSTTAGADYMQIWLHGDRDKKAENDASSVFMWDKGVSKDGAGADWTLAAGNQNASDMDGVATTTPWDDTAHVRYSVYDVDAVSVTDDFVWVQISLDIPGSPDAITQHTGTITIDFEATTH